MTGVRARAKAAPLQKICGVNTPYHSHAASESRTASVV